MRVMATTRPPFKGGVGRQAGTPPPNCPRLRRTLDSLLPSREDRSQVGRKGRSGSQALGEEINPKWTDNLFPHWLRGWP